MRKLAADIASPSAAAGNGAPPSPVQLGDLTHWFDPSHFVGAVIIGLLFLLCGMVLSAVIRRTVNSIIAHDQREHLDSMTISFISRLATFVMWIILALIYSHVVPALNKVSTSLLAGVSIVSVVIGFAAQSTLGNLVSGISLVIYKPFRRGDRLQITAPTGLETGIVEDLSLGYTVLRTFDNRRIVLSNGTMANLVMINLSSIDPRMMLTMPVSISYNSDIDKAREIVLALAKSHGDIDEVVGCPVTALAASSVDMTLRAWCADSGKVAGAQHDLLEQIKKAFDKAGIEIPHPYRNTIVSGSLDIAGLDSAPAYDPPSRG